MDRQHYSHSVLRHPFWKSSILNHGRYGAYLFINPWKQNLIAELHLNTRISLLLTNPKKSRSIIWLGNSIRSSSWLPIYFLWNMETPSSESLPPNHWMVVKPPFFMGDLPSRTRKTPHLCDAFDGRDRQLIGFTHFLVSGLCRGEFQALWVDF